MQVRKFAALVAIPVVATAALAACGSGGSGSGGSGTVKIGIGEPKHLVPTNTNDSTGSQVGKALFTPLVSFDKDNKAILQAADKIETKDSKVWTITIKDGWTFHNGEKVTAQSYIDAWNFGALGSNGQENNSFFDKISGYDVLNPTDKAAVPATKTLAGLKKISDTQFEVTLDKPYADFKSVISYDAFSPMPKVAYDDMKKFEEAPIGQGPFKMKGVWAHNDQINVEAYADYKGTKPKVANIQFKVYLQPTAEYTDLIANNVDVMTAIPTESLGSVKGDLGDRYQQSPSSNFAFIALPAYDAQFAKPEVRKAISMSINRDELAKTIFKGSVKPADAFVSPVVPGYKAGACGEACTYDPTKAKALLDAAGGLPTGKMIITYNADGGHKEWIEAACNQISKALSVQCIGTPEPKFADVRTKAKAKVDIGAFRLGWVMDYPSMENYLAPLYGGNPLGSSNYYGYNNPTFDATVAAGTTATSDADAIKKYQEAEQMLVKDVPVAPVYFGQNNFGFSTKVKNVEVDASTKVDLLKIETK